MLLEFKPPLLEFPDRVVKKYKLNEGWHEFRLEGANDAWTLYFFSGDNVIPKEIWNSAEGWK